MTHSPSRAAEPATWAELADDCGIAAIYHDAWGHPHPTSETTRRALLAAMHPSMGDDPARIRHKLATAKWEQTLPPVCVVPADAPAHIPLTLHTGATSARWRWTLTLEDGSAQTHADFTPADLPRVCESDFADHPLGHLVRFDLQLPAAGVPGYHCLVLSSPAGETHTLPLIAVPHHCHRPAALVAGERIWGLSVQLYGVRSQRNWGIGDFTDLRHLIDFVHAAGGDFIGLNPLHALFPDNPAHISPYSPSQRAFLNTLYLDVEAIPEFSACAKAQHHVASAGFQAELQRLCEGELVDYPGVARAKSAVLDLLFAHFQAEGGQRAEEFAAWRAAQGTALEHHARFCALQAHFRTQNPHTWGWPQWPEAYREVDSAAVAEFAAVHADTVCHYAWLQWLADGQLADASSAAEQHGMAVGLYCDLAIGANPGGAETWEWRDTFAIGAHTGAPPDEINSVGQDWGLPPFAPERLSAAAYAPFIAVLRANMRHAGALRIDHVMGLMRLFWVPAGTPATEGTYVGYPFEDLLGIVALESLRNRCLVIGEDLGTVPEGFRPRLEECGVFSYHPLIFERDAEGQFRLPATMPRQSLASFSTHDLPTLRGFWRGTDLDARATLGLFPNEALAERLVTEREWDRGRLLWALEREGLLPAGVDKNPNDMPDLNAATVAATHAYLARTAALILAVQPEDLLGVIEQPNLPGTLEHQHPNWQRRLPLSIENWHNDPRIAAISETLRRERGARPTK